MTRLTLAERDEARFWSKVALPNGEGCMLWLASLRAGGYGRIKFGGRWGREYAAHRVAYELRVGPIPDGLVLDHLCRVRHCVNPEHLEAVTQGENIRRGETGRAGGAKQRTKTHCPQGHPYDEANMYSRPDGIRRCRACRRLQDRKYYERKIA